MAKRKADSPLNALLPNKPLRETRRSSRSTPVPKWPQGKENENVGGLGSAFETPLRNAKLLPGEVLSYKRSRLGVDVDPNSDNSTGRKRFKRPPKEHSLLESRVTTLRKDSSTAERPLVEQVTNGLCDVEGYCGGSSGNQHDFTEVAAILPRDPENPDRCLTYTRRGSSSTSKGVSPSCPVSKENDHSSWNRITDRSGLEDIEARHEPTLEGNGGSEQIVMLSDEDIVDSLATEKGKKGTPLSVNPDSDHKDQRRIELTGVNNRCSEDECVKLTTTDDHSPFLEEAVGTKTCDGNPRNDKTPAETDRLVSEKTSNSRGSDGRQRTQGVPNGSLEGNGARCPTCSGSSRPHMDAEAAVQVLEEAYNKLYNKYQRSKTRNLAEFEAVYDEQTRKFAAFATAADALVEKLREENSFLTRQLQETGVQESINRSRQIEEEFIECRNDLVMERSKVLELEEELREAHLCILELRTSCSDMDPAQQSCDLQTNQAAKPTVETGARPQSIDMENITRNTSSGVESESECAQKKLSIEDALRSSEEAEVEGCTRQPASETFPIGQGGNKLLHELLQSLTHMSAVVDGNSCRINFTHDESGG